MHRIVVAAALSAAVWISGTMADAASPSAERTAFGALKDGRPVEAVTLSDGHGLKARIITLGAILQTLDVPDRQGRSADVVLGYDTAAEYLATPRYYGASIGRYANRIAHGVFTLDGHRYELATNDGPNTLHGGKEGFDKKLWTIVRVQGGAHPSVTLAYTSPDGEEGYPGTLKAEVTYAIPHKGELSIEYRATTDKPTIVNLTNHSYFNLAGEASGESILDQTLMVHASRITPVDKTLIPTGERTPVAGTPFDFTTPTRIGAHLRDGRNEQIRMGHGVDHNFILDGSSGALRVVAVLKDPGSGREMELLSDQPGLQVYTGNFLDGLAPGKGQRLYRQGDALCLEPQVFPDAPNHPDFPSARLDPGKTYVNRMAYRFVAAKR